MNDDITYDWKKLINTLKKWFSREQCWDIKKSVIWKLSKFQQKQKTLSEYCETEHNLLWRLENNSEWNQDVADVLIDRLSDSVLKKVVEKIMNSVHYMFEDVIEKIHSVAQDEPVQNNSLQEKYSAVKSKNRELIWFLSQVKKNQWKKNEVMLQLINQYANFFFQKNRPAMVSVHS